MRTHRMEVDTFWGMHNAKFRNTPENCEKIRAYPGTSQNFLKFYNRIDNLHSPYYDDNLIKA